MRRTYHMKKILALVLALCLCLAAAASLADGVAKEDTPTTYYRA